jgi:hypothetical protein
MPIELTQYELSLLSKALELARQDSTLTRDGLKRALHCGSDTAQRLLTHIETKEMIKVAEHLEKLPENAEVRAEVSYALGDQSGSAYSHVLQENSRLSRALAKTKYVLKGKDKQRNHDIRAEIELLKSEAKVERKFSAVKPVKASGLLLEVCIADAHFGRLCYSKETNDAPFDLLIAQSVYMRALETLLERAKGYSYERILFPLGHDLLHSNGMNNATAGGTPLDCDDRYQKVFTLVRQTMAEVIERLRLLAPVDIPVIAGNHDRTVWTLADSLSSWFRGCPDVNIDNSPTLRKVYSWGTCGFLLTHGDAGKKADYPLTFATEFPEVFSNSTWREIQQGHFHKTALDETHGVKIRTLPSLAPADFWHYEQMYTGNMRNAEAYVFSKTEGQIASFTYCDNMRPVIKTERKLVQ